jgi:hypothetical protein
MTDDELMTATLEAVHAERRRRAHEERLEAYVEGKLDEAAVAELARSGGTDADLEDELVAFRPLDGAARAEIHAKVLREMNAEPTPSRRGRLLPFRALKGRAVSAIVGAVALAASVALVVHVRSQPTALPRYDLAFVGGERDWRGEAPAVDPGSEHRFSRGELVRLLVRPRTAVREPVAARVFLRRGDNVRPWPAPVEISSAGAVRVAGSPETLPPGTEGDWEVVVAIGRQEAMPGADDLDAARAAKDGVQIVTARVTFEQR